MVTRKRSSSARLGSSLERLEDRQMMAGDVAVSIVNGNMVVSEVAGQAGAPNAIEISQLANGRIRVAGLNNGSGGQTLVNGVGSRDFVFNPPAGTSGELVVNLGGGNDVVRIGNGQSLNRFNSVVVNTSNSFQGQTTQDADIVLVNGLSTRGRVIITTGDGNDRVDVSNANVAHTLPGSLIIETGFGNDSVSVASVQTKQSARIGTGAGNDFILVAGSTIGDGIGNDSLGIYTGSGNDTVNFSHANWQRVRGNLVISTADNVLLNEPDRINLINTIVDRSLTVTMGGGNDTLSMRGVRVADDIGLYGDRGDDQFSLSDVIATDDFFAIMGDGNDTLGLEYVGADQLLADGGAGVDRLTQSGRTYRRTSTLRNFETINGINQALFSTSSQIVSRPGLTASA